MEKKGMSVEDVRKQAEITAKRIMERLKSSIEHGFMTYPELIRILRYSLKTAIDEMCLLRPENMPLPSVGEVGLQDLYHVLEKIEEEETKKAKEIEKRLKQPRIALP